MINYFKTNSMVIATDFTSICCFYKEKKTTHAEAWRTKRHRNSEICNIQLARIVENSI